MSCLRGQEFQHGRVSVHYAAGPLGSIRGCIKLTGVGCATELWVVETALLLCSSSAGLCAWVGEFSAAPCKWHPCFHV